MELLIVSFLAGVLTVLSPCVLPLLPIIIGGSVSQEKNYIKPLVIIISLAVSVIVFTLLIKASTLLIDIHPNFWKIVSGGIITILGVSMLFPSVWSWVEIKLGFGEGSNKLLNSAQSKEGIIGDIFIGGALGPVFTSCSPTYGLILATVLPTSFFFGLVNLIAFALGLAFIMFLIAIFGQAIIRKLKWAANPNGWFRKFLGIIFVIVGMLVMLGIDKQIETYLVEEGYFYIPEFEIQAVEKFEESLNDESSSASNE